MTIMGQLRRFGFVSLLSLWFLDETSAFYCPPTQRYDIAQFPPRCIDCPQIVSNRMTIARIPTQLNVRRTALKFSPGLPQNETCGCWRAPVNQTVDVVLNSSLWVVSGFIFNNNRGRWLKEVAIQASGDNVTFMDWGNFTAANFTDASFALFSLPIRARFFRLTILRYANHYINLTTGYPLSVQALVSQTQPFTCNCPMLSNGTCCPYMNMTVYNDQCRWCMDPTQISTIMVNGCGVCRKGTFEYQGRCYYRLPANPLNNLVLSDPTSDGVFWTAQLELSTDDRTTPMLYLTNRTNYTHPCLLNQTLLCLMVASRSHNDYIPILSPPMRRGLVPALASQYLQFDRGRYVLNMTQPVVRSWAVCPSYAICTGNLGVLFVTWFPGALVRVQGLQQALRFQFGVPNFLCYGQGSQALMFAKMELHLFLLTNTWMIRVIGIRLQGSVAYVQWDQTPPLAYANTVSEFITIDTPPLDWNQSLKVSDWLNGTTLEVQAPISVVVHSATASVHYSGIAIQIRYGLGFSDHPVPGDSEQIVFVAATSPQAVRLGKLLSSLNDNTPVLYTNPKGFLMAPSSVLDLGLACATMSPSALSLWLITAIQLLPPVPLPNSLSRYVQKSCDLVLSGAVARAYWMIPYRVQPAGRTDQVPVEITAQFA